MQVGQGKFQTALLIELVDPALLSEKDKDPLIKDLWPYVEKANGPAPAHARIQEEFVIFFDPSKPFLRATKGYGAANCNGTPLPTRNR